MLTEKDYCDYETCVALKELGYPIDWFEDETYHENNTEISLYEAQKWLREEKEINISPIYLFTDWGCMIKTPKYGDLIESHSSYEEALSEGIKEVVKILKEK
jgi:hypothetical protein